MNKQTFLLIFLFGIFTGFALTFLEPLISVLRTLDWQSLLYWLTLFLGALIPIAVNYLSIKKQEVLRIKSRFAQDKIDIIREIGKFDLQMRSTIILDKSLNDMTISYNPTKEDAAAPYLRGLWILQTHENFSDWREECIASFEKLDYLRCNDVSNYIWYMSSYILNLVHAIETIPNEKLWEVSVCVRSDFFEMSGELKKLIDRYIDNDLIRFHNDKRVAVTSNIENSIGLRLKNSNLEKYKNEIKKLRNDLSPRSFINTIGD